MFLTPRTGTGVHGLSASPGQDALRIPVGNPVLLHVTDPWPWFSICYSGGELGSNINSHENMWMNKLYINVWVHIHAPKHPPTCIETHLFIQAHPHTPINPPTSTRTDLPPHSNTHPSIHPPTHTYQTPTQPYTHLNTNPTTPPGISTHLSPTSPLAYPRFHSHPPTLSSHHPTHIDRGKGENWLLNLINNGKMFLIPWQLINSL